MAGRGVVRSASIFSRAETDSSPRIPAARSRSAIELSPFARGATSFSNASNVVATPFILATTKRQFSPQARNGLRSSVAGLVSDAKHQRAVEATIINAASADDDRSPKHFRMVKCGLMPIVPASAWR